MLSHTKQGEPYHHQEELGEKKKTHNQTQHKSLNLTHLKQHHHLGRQNKLPMGLDEIFFFKPSALTQFYVHLKNSLNNACLWLHIQ